MLTVRDGSERAKRYLSEVSLDNVYLIQKGFATSLRFSRVTRR